MVTFAQAAAARDQRWAVLITIEGFGTYDGLWRLCSIVPDYASGSALYKPWLVDWPTILSERVPPIGGAVEAGELAIEVLDHDDALTAAFRTRRKAATLLASAISSSATSIDVINAATLSSNSVVWCGNEAWRVTNVVGNTLTVTRAWLGTTARAHAVKDPVFSSIPYLRSRRLTVYLAPVDGDDATTETDFGAYFLDTLELSDDLNSYVLRGKSQSKYAARNVASLPLTGTAVLVWGDEQYPHLSIRWTDQQQRPNPVLDDIFSDETDVYLRLEDEILTWTASGGYGHFTDAPITRRGLGGTKPGGAIEIGASVMQVWLADASTMLPGAFRYSPGPAPSSSRSAGTWTRSDHWIDIILCLLTSSAHPDDGLELTNYLTSGSDAERSNWSSLPPGVGIGVPVAEIDVAGLLATKARTPDWRFPHFVVGDKPRPFAELLEEQILKPLGAYLTARAGKIAIVLPRTPLEDEALTTIGSEQILTRATGKRAYQAELRAAQDMSLLASAVRFTGLRRTDGEEHTLTVSAAEFAATYGQGGLYTLEEQPLEIEAASALAIETGDVGFLELVAMRHLWRFHRPPWRVQVETDVSLYAQVAGALVGLTCAELPDEDTGTRGWTAAPAQVEQRTLEVTPDHGARLIWDLIAYGGGGRFGRVGPSADINVVVGNAATVTANRYAHIDAPSDLPSTDAAGFLVDDVVALKNRDGSSAAAGTQIVQNVVGNVITLDGNFGGALAADKLLVYADRASAVAQQYETFTFWADQTQLTVGASADDPWTYGEQ